MVSNLDERTKLMLQILDASRQGVAKESLEKILGLSHQQMRDITAELADKGFLRHVGDGLYMTTEDGYRFMQSRALRPSLLSNEEINDSL